MLEVDSDISKVEAVIVDVDGSSGSVVLDIVRFLGRDGPAVP